jgi:sulfhydrogenase subunit alpha
MNGAIASSDGATVDVGKYEQCFYEEHVEHSTALHAHRVGNPLPYQVGPMARVHLSYDQLSSTVRSLAEEIGWQLPSFNPYHSIIARGLELVQAFEEGLSILKSFDSKVEARVAYETAEASGCAATEAPRGLIYHRYDLDQSGHVCRAKIVPPTSQNQRQIERDLVQILPSMLAETDESIARRCETLIRNYDPCISCATHFLKVRRTKGVES